jgi:hypothetical protein
MSSTRRSKRSPSSSSSASPDRRGAEARLEALLRERLGAEVGRIASVVLEILVAEGWTPPTQPATPAAGSAETASAAPAAAALFDAARAGGAEYVLRLIDLPVEALRRLVGDLGYDPARQARKWKDRDRLLNFIADETVKRVHRNQAFKREPAAEPPQNPLDRGAHGSDSEMSPDLSQPVVMPVRVRKFERFKANVQMGDNYNDRIATLEDGTKIWIAMSGALSRVQVDEHEDYYRKRLGNITDAVLRHLMSEHKEVRVNGEYVFHPGSGNLRYARLTFL